MAGNDTGFTDMRTHGPSGGRRTVVDFKTTTLAEIGAEPVVDRRAVGIDLRDEAGAL